MKTKCTYAAKYKATRAPVCLSGYVCDVCQEKWDNK